MGEIQPPSSSWRPSVFHWLYRWQPSARPSVEDCVWKLQRLGGRAPLKAGFGALGWLGAALAADFLFGWYIDKRRIPRMVEAFERGSRELTFEDTEYYPRPALEAALKPILAPTFSKHFSMVSGEVDTGKTSVVKKVCKELGGGILYCSLPRPISLHSNHSAHSDIHHKPHSQNPPYSNISNRSNISNLHSNISNPHSNMYPNYHNSGSQEDRDRDDSLQEKEKSELFRHLCDVLDYDAGRYTGLWSLLVGWVPEERNLGRLYRDLEIAAAQYHAKHHRPAALVFDNIEPAVKYVPLLFDDLVGVAKDGADTGHLAVTFVATTGHTTNHIQNLCEASRLQKPIFEVDDLSLDEAQQFITSRLATQQEEELFLASHEGILNAKRKSEATPVPDSEPKLAPESVLSKFVRSFKIFQKNEKNDQLEFYKDVPQEVIDDAKAAFLNSRKALAEEVVEFCGGRMFLLSNAITKLNAGKYTPSEIRRSYLRYVEYRIFHWGLELYHDPASLSLRHLKAWNAAIRLADSPDHEEPYHEFRACTGVLSDELLDQKMFTFHPSRRTVGFVSRPMALYASKVVGSPNSAKRKALQQRLSALSTRLTHSNLQTAAGSKLGQKSRNR